MKPATTTLAATATLALGFGRSKTLVAVADCADASRIYRAAVRQREDEDLASASTMPTGHVYEVRGASVRRIATVSYNGKVWRGARLTLDAALIFNPYAATGGAR